ncbi:MAG TPA: hypothetical protein PKC18_16530 [Lacipirellulaceae bacterium]|nr:hypothetical protein [Lacipirellulaceae bacterium]
MMSQNSVDDADCPVGNVGWDFCHGDAADFFLRVEDRCGQFGEIGINPCSADLCGGQSFVEQLCDFGGDDVASSGDIVG